MKITHWIASNSYAIFITEIDPSTGYFVFAARQVRRTSCNRTKNYAAACRAAAAAIDRFLLHAPDLSSKPPGAAAAVDRRDRHTDGHTTVLRRLLRTRRTERVISRAVCI